jgi:hypothetical protein
MKKTTHLVAALLFAIAPALLAQSSVPSFISYQGRVAANDGTPVGNGTAVNRTLVFRIWSGLSSTGSSNLLYSEKQTVTILNGEFSVLIGTGESVTNSPLGFDETSKKLSTILTDSLWENSTRYLGVTVYNDGASTGTEISPRQQLVATPYAIRAKIAEGVSNNAITASMIAPATITADRIMPGNLTASLFANATITSTQISNNAIGTSQLANATVTTAKLSSDIGVWTLSNSNVYRSTGLVGIGTTSPLSPLSFADATGAKILLSGSNATSQNGLSVSSAGLLIHSKSNEAINFGTGGGTDSTFTTNMRLLSDGKLGIGTAAPAEKLDVLGTIRASTGFVATGNSKNATFGVAASSGNLSTSAAAGDAVLRAESGKLILQSGTGAGSILIGTDNAPTFNQKATFSSGLVTNDISYSVGSDTWKIYSTGTNNDMALYIKTEDDNNEPIILKIGSTDRLRVDSDGITSTGIVRSVGTRNGAAGYADMYYDPSDPPNAAPAGALTLRLYNSNSAGLNTRHLSWDGDGNWDFESDVRLKENIHDAEPMLDRLLDLKIRRYNWKNSPSSQPLLGVVAQEVQPLFPDLVKSHKFENGLDETLTVSYDSFGLLAVKSVQELHESLVKELDDKDQKIKSLEERLEKLEALIQSR